MLVKPTTDVIAKIKVVGIGGGGGNAVNTMISQYGIEGVEFITVNTDAQVLKNSLAPIQLQLGHELTRGLGAGGDPKIGSQAAEESVDSIHEHLAGADMVFLTCGMGGGTGTGAAPIIASIAKNLGALTVAVVTKPFDFEGKRRMEVALAGIEELKDKVDTLIVIPNQRLLDIIDKKISFLDALRRVDEVLALGVKSISGLITQSGLINVDFADVKSVMTDAGTALMGIGSATGEDRAATAARQATSSPLLEASIDGATGVLFTVTGGLDMSMHEVDQAAQMIQEAVSPSANIIFGATIDEGVKDEIQITVLATGFSASSAVMPTSRQRAVPETVIERDQQVQRPQSPEAKKTTPQTPERTKGRTAEDSDTPDDETLDVPAFLRRREPR
ncbi:MAG: cell division protein FtsZ [Candidatus Dojkabacteria bacterium]|nr:cell division protein FtsZ [Candidatus Dojkabacteria bacterium]